MWLFVVRQGVGRRVTRTASHVVKRNGTRGGEFDNLPTLVDAVRRLDAAHAQIVQTEAKLSWRSELLAVD